MDLRSTIDKLNGAPYTGIMSKLNPNVAVAHQAVSCALEWGRFNARIDDPEALDYLDRMGSMVRITQSSRDRGTYTIARRST